MQERKQERRKKRNEAELQDCKIRSKVMRELTSDKSADVLTRRLTSVGKAGNRVLTSAWARRSSLAWRTFGTRAGIRWVGDAYRYIISLFSLRLRSRGDCRRRSARWHFHLHGGRFRLARCQLSGRKPFQRTRYSYRLRTFRRARIFSGV